MSPLRISNLSVPTQRNHQRRGTAAVEFAVILPFIVLLLLGVWEAGRLIEVQQIMNNAAREGARQAAGGQLNTSQVQTIVTNYLTDAGIPSTNAIVTVQNLGHTGNPTPPDNNPQNATQMDQLQVSVSVPFKDVRWLSMNLMTSSTTLLTAQASWSSIQDISYPSVDYPPASP